MIILPEWVDSLKIAVFYYNTCYRCQQTLTFQKNRLTCYNILWEDKLLSKQCFIQ